MGYEKWKINLKKRRKLSKFSVFYFLLSIFCLFCISISPVFSQKRNALGWIWQNPLPQGNPLYAIHFAKDKETGFAVGADSTILATTDGGFNWQKQISPIDTILSGVFVKDNRNVFIVGARGIIISTNNGGKDWKQVEVPTKNHLYSLTFTGDNLNTGRAVGTYGEILITSDGGLTWKSQRQRNRRTTIESCSFRC